jgi:ribonucleotide reductase beta subunit family protein with ferritin-like domain
MPRGVLGLNAPMFKGYLRFIANRRASRSAWSSCSRTRKTRSRG